MNMIKSAVVVKVGLISFNIALIMHGSAMLGHGNIKTHRKKQDG